LKLDINSIREHFPFLQEAIDFRVKNPSKDTRIFTDSTASTQMPKEILEVIAKKLFSYANIHRGQYNASIETTEEFERVYNIAANLVNADSWREIILGRNATEMINLVMRGMAGQFRHGDNVVTTKLEHNSDYVPWYGLQQSLANFGKHIDVRVVDFDPETGELDMGQLESMVDSRTKIVACTGASNFMGIKPDIKRIGAIAHSSKYEQPDGSRGSYFLVDGAQLVPGTPVDVQDIGCDFLAWSFHKMLVPLGVGGLYGRKAVMEQLDPFLFGGDMIQDADVGMVTYKELPWKFTAGTPNILGGIASGYGMIFLMNLGLGNMNRNVAGDVATEIGRQNRAIETEVLMNTPRGDFGYKFSVPKHLHEQFREYLRRHPNIAEALRNPEARIERTRETVKRAMGNINAHTRELTQYGLDLLSKDPRIKIYGPMDASKRTSLIAFNIDGIDAESLATHLNKRHVEVRSGHHCASLAHHYLGIPGSERMSFYVYNTKKEVEAAVEAVHEMSRKLEGVEK
jgi:cysteine desulfurase/selenocysteine lyase